MRMISIDPGAKGVIVFWRDDRVHRITDIPQMLWGSKQTIPNPDRVRELIVNYEPEVIVIERVTAAPRGGKVSTGNFLQGLGILQGCCAGYRLEFIRPQLWKAATGLTKLAKAAAVDKAILRQPECESMVRGHKNAIDRADAVLLGLVWRIMSKGKK